MEILSPEEFFKRVGTPESWKPLNPEGEQEMRSITHIVEEVWPHPKGEEEMSEQELEMTPEEKMRQGIRDRVKGGGKKVVETIRIFQGLEQSLQVALGAEVLGVGMDQGGLLLFIMEDPSLPSTQRLEIAVRRDGEDCSDLNAYQYMGSIYPTRTDLPEGVSQPTIHVFNRSK